MNNTKTLVMPDERDGMPYEAATAMLSEPKARLTGTMRRNLKLTRAKIYTSTVPLLRNGLDAQDRAYYKRDADKQQSASRTDARDAAKMALYSMAQLVRWLRRSVNRRQTAQNK